MAAERAQERAAAISKMHASTAQRTLTMKELLEQSSAAPITFFKPKVINWHHIEPGKVPHKDQTELFVPILREDFEIAEDDEAGLIVEVQSDFLLSGVHVAVKNRHTGQMVEFEQRDDTNRMVLRRMVPGPYELIVYTHEGVTNIGSTKGGKIDSFDLVLQMSVRLLRLADQAHAAEAKVPVEILDTPHSGGGQGEQPHSLATPVVVTEGELRCLKHYQPLPQSLEAYHIAGAIDITETFYITTKAYLSHEMSFTPREGQDALRVLLIKSNSKIAVFEESGRRLVAQSRPLDNAKGQLLIAQNLEVGTNYTIVLEFSEQVGGLDGETAVECDHFVVAVTTWDSKRRCTEATGHDDTDLLVTRPDSDPQVATVPIKMKREKRELRIAGTDPVDLEITVDFSDTLYMPVVSLKAHADELQAATSTEGSNDEEAEAVADGRRAFAPATVDSTKKRSTTYFFTELPAGSYVLKLR